jgi:hemerythrin-like domain-containing protein
MLRDPGLIPLSHDHQHALALCVLTERALAAGAPPEEVDAAAGRIIRLFDSEMRGHFEFEEQVLFPVLGHIESLAELIATLVGEHKAMIALVHRLRTNTVRADVEQFLKLLRGHVQKEERSLFEQAQQLLSREQLDTIGEARRHWSVSSKNCPITEANPRQ